MKLFISREEAHHICDKSQYNEASLWEKIKLNIRLIYCSASRKYTARNTKLTKKIKQGKLKNLGLSEKELLKQKLQQAIQNK